MQIITYDKEEFVNSAAIKLKQEILFLLKSSKNITIGLSGGNSPLPVYKKLSSFKLDWERIQFFIVDERCVPLENDQNNYSNISNNLFNHINSDNFSPVVDNITYEECASQYEALIKKNVTSVDGIPQFDLIVLGMGLDGHTASLFPNTLAIDNTKDLYVLNHVEQLNTDRLTMTFPLISNSKRIVLLAQGNEKKQVLLDVINNELPIFKILPKTDVILN